MKQLVKSLSYILSISLIVFLLPINTNAATPTYNYEWVSQSGTISADGLAHEYTNLTAGQTINLSLTLYNRSGNTIQNRHKLGNSPDKQVPIGSWGIGSQTPHQDGTPHFLDTSSFVLNNNRFAYYEGNDVPNNSLITMNWNIKLANNLADGIYNLYVRPVSEYLAWTRQIKNGKLLPTTSSDIYWRFVVGDGTTEYLTYTNSEYGFQLSHPKNWKITEPLYNTRGWKIYFGTKPIIGAQDYSSIVAVSNNSLNQEVQSLRDNTYEYSLPNDSGHRGYEYSISEQSVTLNDMPALSVIVTKTYTHPDPVMFPSRQSIEQHYFLELNEHVFVLQGSISIEDGHIINSNGSIGLDIIKTFQELV